MTTTRFLTGLLAVVATTGPVRAQFGDESSSTPGPYPLIPPVRPSEPENPQVRPASAVMPPGRPYAATATVPAHRFAASNTTALDRVTAPTQAASAEESDPVGTLTSQTQPQYGASLPLGAYPSPYYADGPGCCGPLGRNGRVGYELYLYTGPTWAIGEGEFTRRLQTGWMVGGGGRSLFFNSSHTAAWVADVGLSYQYNRGESDDPIFVDVRQPPFVNPITGQTIPQPDVRTEVIIRALNRTNFNFGIGRDWWLRGPGSTGLVDNVNTRVGALVGGRWGTAHIDMVPVDEPDGYRRRQNVTKGVFIAAHATIEIPMGTWVWFSGLRTEWGYDWTNLAPPNNGNIHNLNLLLTTGIRF